ncbi:inositol 2-dehydrogenase [Bacillus taeanensis]|uniref:Inositol 2-dehydrogenase n=1 Tax=Bacillus taeanensis TaxID=273032 RepID=A0A366XSB9_9BACI|nr:inositol 2-dehydrogenase [Bacillus taeanensis]RBW69280.1 inositol 2-dehydrogenase [Bacillus taeanensis]
MDKIVIGIIGAGRIGRLHAENIVQIPQVEIKTISDIFADNAREWAAQIGIPHVTTDYQEILNDSDIDAVFICSPTNTHAPIIKEAAKAGKHIFCEKPVSFSAEETKEALQVVKEAGVKLQVGFNRRFDHNFKKVHDTVKAGTIGDTHIVKITSRDPEPPPAEYIKSSGGMFMDMSIHDFDMARYVTGSEVEEVYVQGASLVDPVFAELGDVDTAVITLKFENGAIGVIDNSRKAVYGYDQRVEVFGSKGSVSIQNDQPTTAEISTAEGVFQDKPQYFFLERYKDAYINETHAFINSVLYNTPLVCEGNDGLQAELIAKAAKESFETGKPVKVANKQYTLN